MVTGLVTRTLSLIAKFLLLILGPNNFESLCQACLFGYAIANACSHQNSSFHFAISGAFKAKLVSCSSELSLVCERIALRFSLNREVKDKGERQKTKGER